jgi:hypothetical protein
MMKKRLYRVSGETKEGYIRTYTFQTKSRATACATRWAKGSEGDSWLDPIAPLKNVRIDVSEPVFFPSDFGTPKTIPFYNPTENDE